MQKEVLCTGLSNLVSNFPVIAGAMNHSNIRRKRYAVRTAETKLKENSLLQFYVRRPHLWNERENSYFGNVLGLFQAH